MKTTLEIIDGVLAPYIADPSKRSVKHSGTCSYLMEDGRMCALGQCLDPEHPNYRHIVNENKPADEIPQLNGAEQEILKEEFRGHPVEFWQDLQNMHDGFHNWNPGGMSEHGHARLKLLKLKWAPASAAVPAVPCAVQ